MNPATRAEAVECLLVEKRAVDPSVIDAVIEDYGASVGPRNWAKEAEPDLHRASTGSRAPYLRTEAGAPSRWRRFIHTDPSGPPNNVFSRRSGGWGARSSSKRWETIATISAISIRANVAA